MAELRAATLLALAAFAAAGVAGCRHPVMVADGGPQPPTADGTISGRLQTPDNGAAVVDRLVTVINNADNQRYQVRTNNTGGFTLKVPPGRYRVEVETRAGEIVSGAPADQQVGSSDMDSGLVITIGPAS